VDRNKVKRRIREIVRTERLVRPELGEMVIFALPAAYAASFDALREELTTLCKRASR
jgi:ribonuclease P protein component